VRIKKQEVNQGYREHMMAWENKYLEEEEKRTGCMTCSIRNNGTFSYLFSPKETCGLLNRWY